MSASREHGSAAEPAADHGMDGLFGPRDADGGVDLLGEPAPYQTASAGSGGPPSRGDRHRHRAGQRRKGRRRAVTLIAVLIVVVLAIGGFVAVRRLTSYLSPADYSGTGTSAVLVQVRPGDGTADIGDTLVSKDVVASRRAFVDAAQDSGRSQDFQPGFFALREHMSSSSAVSALLDSENRRSDKVTLQEGITTIATQTPSVPKVLAAGLGSSPDAVSAALQKVSDLGIASTYGNPTSAEGFLFPSTYEFDPGTTPAAALQQMVSQFAAEDRNLSFSASTAATLKVSPYAKLIIASIVESEARFDADRGKVAQVLYNRIKAHMPLQSDATSAYGAKLAGQDPGTVDYQKPAPYNTRRSTKLPPTPIGNPGASSMQAAATPTAGNWLYFVSADADGHLFFTNSYSQFLVAANKCVKNHWGCT